MSKQKNIVWCSIFSECQSDASLLVDKQFQLQKQSFERISLKNKSKNSKKASAKITPLTHSKTYSNRVISLTATRKSNKVNQQGKERLLTEMKENINKELQQIDHIMQIYSKVYERKKSQLISVSKSLLQSKHSKNSEEFLY